MSTSTVLSPAGVHSGLVAVDRLDEQEVALAHAAAERPDEVALREEVASVSDDRPTPPEGRTTQTDAITRPSDAARDDHSAGGEAVALTNDPTAANDPSDAESQPEWGVAPDDFHAGSPDDTSDDEDSQQPDIPGGEAEGTPDSEAPEVDDNGVTDLGTEATTLPDLNETPPGATTAAVGDAAPAASSTEASQAGSAAADEAADDEEQRVPHLNSKVLDQLLDEASGDLVALEAFDREVDDRAFESDWFGAHNDISRQAIREELLRKGEYTGHVDDAGNLLSDPDEYRLAVEVNARITLCVHRERSEDQKREFILRSQTGKRILTYAEQRALTNNLIVVQLRLGVDYKSIAKMAGVHPNTVRNVENRAAADPNSTLGNTKRPDGRFSPENRQKVATARELRAAGLSKSDIASLLDTDLETVEKLLKDPTSKAKKKNKHKPVAATQQTVDLAASDGIPKVHRAALDRLGKDAEDYIKWLEDAFADAQEEMKAVADGEEGVLKLALRSGLLLALYNSRLKSNRGGEVDIEESPPGDLRSDGDWYKPGTILRGVVMDVGPVEVFVVLPDGRTGVIDNRDNRLAQYGPLEVGKAYRVQVEGFDPGRDLVIVLPQGLQTPAPYERSTSLGSDCDEGSSPDAEDAACEADAETTEVSA